MSRFPLTLATALLVLASACGSTAGAPSTTASVTVASVPGTPTSTRIVVDTPPTTVLIEPNRLTSREISEAELMLMLFDAPPDPWSAYAGPGVEAESNDVFVARALDRFDAEADIREFGRLNGARATYRSRFTAGAAGAIESWVMEFADDRGASGYLDDYIGDTAKGLEGGRVGRYQIDDVAEFAIDPVGDQVIGVVLTEVTPTGSPRYETVVGFRVGRILAFSTLLRNDDADIRIPAQRLAEDLRDRINDVLAGRLRPTTPQRDAVLASYEFTYEQILSERYTIVVFPTVIVDDEMGDDEIGGGEGTGDGEPDESTTTSSSLPAGDDSSTTSSTTTSSTTTTTRIVEIETIGRVEATGVVSGDAMTCGLTLVLDSGLQRREYAVIGDTAYTEINGELTELSVDDEPAAGDLIYCPGWEIPLRQSGFFGLLLPGSGTLEEYNGIPSRRYELGAEELAAIGIGPEPDSGVIIDFFSIWVADEAPWVIGIDLKYRGKTEVLEPALGPGFVAGADVTIEIAFSAERLNDSTIEVSVPQPGR